AQLLNWHRREDKGFWWRYFYLRDELSDSERREEKDALGELEFIRSWPDPAPRARSTFFRFRFPPQDHDVKPGSSPRDPETGASAGTVADIDDKQGTIDLRRGNQGPPPAPRSLIPFDYVNATPKPDSLMRLATWIMENGIDSPGPFKVGRDLLRRRRPSLGQNEGVSLVGADEAAADAAQRLALRMSGTYLAIQGPPGSGKSTVGAEIIVDLVAAGKRVGVTANSHKVIGELLAKVVRAAEKRALALQIVQRTSAEEAPDGIRPLASQQAVDGLLAGSFDVLGATTWLWAREEVAETLDVLVVDEAGQMSLADTLAASPCADSLLLLGDPQQLNQPLKGVHPPGAERSVLGHVLDGERVIPPHLGVFLDGTWRMHPQISEFTSEVFYEGQLRSHPGRELQEIAGEPPLSQTGIRFIGVSHEGNSSSSSEESQMLRELIGALLEARPVYTDSNGQRRPISLSDVLVITPFNAQVARISAAVPGARVGTVDKFQGQEAPISIYSMASSSAAEAPRGMEFLYNLNRLNVATSRAQGLAAIVGSRDLLRVRCRSPRQMRLANALARFIELAEAAS
ncbi:MAG: AAA domain-containing protein, partial [Chloroflexota bacterium]|nr:AAA domain-containing protein [Chloroflexota bacterium]